MEADSLDGKGGFKGLLWVPAGREERQMVSLHSTSPELSSHDHALTHGTLCIRSQVFNTTGFTQ